MTRLLRVLLSWSVLVSCTSLFTLGCFSFSAAPKSYKPDRQDPSPETQTLVPADMLTSLTVVVDACQVFVEPSKRSPAFGPLTRGEMVKWLDARENWIRAWIPRLRISGWVLQGSVKEVQDTNATQPPIPTKELAPVIVVSESVRARDAPTTKSEVALVADKNDVFFLLGEKEGWCRVWLPEQKRAAWIFGKSLVRKAEK